MARSNPVAKADSLGSQWVVDQSVESAADSQKSSWLTVPAIICGAIGGVALGLLLNVTAGWIDPRFAPLIVPWGWFALVIYFPLYIICVSPLRNFVVVSWRWASWKWAWVLICLLVTGGYVFIAHWAIDKCWQALRPQYHTPAPSPKASDYTKPIPAPKNPDIPKPKPKPPKSPPDAIIAIVNPSYPGVLLSNRGQSLMREPRYSVSIFDLDVPSVNGTYVSLSADIPSFKDGWIKPKENSGPYFLFIRGREPRAGDRLFGIARTTCPDCPTERMYWIYMIYREGGWYSELQKGKPSRSILESIFGKPKDVQDSIIGAAIPVNVRMPIVQF